MALELNNLDAVFGRALGNIYQGAATDPRALTGQAWEAVKNVNIASAVDVLKTVGLAATVIFGFLFFWVLIKMNRYFSERAARLKAELNLPSKGEGSYDGKWKEVRKHLQSPRDAEWKFAVVEADKIVDDILRQAGFPGETLGEKLMGTTRYQLQSLDALWAAHKLRNLIAHDPNLNVRYGDVRAAIENYEKTLRELGVLS